MKPTRIRFKKTYIKPTVKPCCAAVLTAVSMLSTVTAPALVISEDFTKGETINKWLLPPVQGNQGNSACLTAGNNQGIASLEFFSQNFGGQLAQKGGVKMVAGSPPRCTGSNVDGSPMNDAVGSGALRITPAAHDKGGGIVSDFEFPTNDGVEILFTTYTFSDGTRTGADGFSFYLSDADRPASVGSVGGALGYACTSLYIYNQSAGVDGAYLGIGLDEYGNFTNGYKVTNPTYPGPELPNNPRPIRANTFTSSPTYSTDSDFARWNEQSSNLWEVSTKQHFSRDNSQDGVGMIGNAISIRGAGNINSQYFAQQFLQDVYTQHGWGTAPADKMEVMRNAWGSLDNGVKTHMVDGNVIANRIYSSTTFQRRGVTWFADPVFRSAGFGRIKSICAGSPLIEQEFDQSKLFITMPIDPSETRTDNHNSLMYVLNPGAVWIPRYLLPENGKMPDGSDIPRQGLGYHVRSKDPNYKLWGYSLLTYKQLDATKYLMYTKTKNRKTATPIQYKIRITPDNKASVWYSYNAGAFQPVLLEQDVVKMNGGKPLPRAFRFGFAGSTGGSYNNHDVTCFKAAPSVTSEGSATVNLPDARIVGGAQVFLSTFNSMFWTGEVEARDIVTNASGTAYSFADKPNWAASCGLNGGTCSATGAVVSKQTDRKLFTWGSSQGVTLDWSNLSAQQKASLMSDGESEDVGMKRLEYLKGDTSQERSSAGVGLFRARKSVLGDVVNASPLWVGYPNSSDYERTWTDNKTNTKGTESGYAAYAAEKAARTNIVFAGSNDGFMHAFRSGNYNSAKTFDKANNDGKEVFAYMPSSVLQRIHNKTNDSLDYSAALYAHNYYNDAIPATGDVYYGGKWHTWMLSGLGMGGNSVYALDITDPDNFSQQNVVGEWSYSASDDVWKNLGNSYGTPVFGRFHDGNWGAVFGNGWCSTEDATNGNCVANNAPAGIYVMSINKNTGAPSFRFISTGEVGTADDPNGIAYVTPADFDGDLIYDYAYAGDLKGNVWRFDLTDTNGRVQKIFTTQNDQPITTSVSVTGKPTDNNYPVLSFGTGRKKDGYLGAGTTYSQSTQSVYGIFDQTALKFPVAVTPNAEVTLEQLQQQSLDEARTGQYYDRNQAFANSQVVSAAKKGWYMNLRTVTQADGTKNYEQVIYNPYVERKKYFVVNTFINNAASQLSCEDVDTTGFTYPFNSVQGILAKGFFNNDFNSEGFGLQFNSTGSPNILKVTVDGETRSLLLSKNRRGGLSLDRVYFPPTEIVLKRLSWKEIY